MIIDFEKIAEAHIEGFKGGEGKLDTRNYVDDRARIMYSTLRPGARDTPTPSRIAPTTTRSTSPSSPPWDRRKRGRKTKRPK